MLMTLYMYNVYVCFWPWFDVCRQNKPWRFDGSTMVKQDSQTSLPRSHFPSRYSASRPDETSNVALCTTKAARSSSMSDFYQRFEPDFIVGDLPPGCKESIFHGSFNEAHDGPLNREECWCSKKQAAWTNAAQYGHRVETLYSILTSQYYTESSTCWRAHDPILVIIVDSTHSHTLSCMILRVDGPCHR